MVGRLEQKLKAQSPDVTRVFIEIQSKETAPAYPAAAPARA